MLCRLHTMYKIIHCAALHTLCDITQRVSNYYTVKWQFFAFNLEKITPGRKFLHRHRLWCLWLISGRVAQGVVSWLAANEDQKNLWGPWDLEGIRTFVAKWDMSRIRAFWNCFDSDLTQSLSLRQMRFDSDFTQTSGQKNGDWSLWSSVAVRLSSVLSPQSSVLNPQSSVLGPQSSVLNPRSSILNPSVHKMTLEQWEGWKRRRANLALLMAK